LKVYSKTIKVLGLTKSEMAQLAEMVEEAKNGQTVHYSERKQPDGSFFGISIDDQYEYIPRERTRDRVPESIPAYPSKPKKY